MRIVDCFTDVILFTRKFCRGELEEMTAEVVRQILQGLFVKSGQTSEEQGMSSDFFLSAKYPVVALVDEMLQTSRWSDKSSWAKNPLQRLYFNTTNAGADFYKKLNVLNKFGPDRDIREVYALCLGLGFRGKYFRGEDRKQYEDIKAFNLSLLLPDEAQRNIDSATLFPFAYKDSDSRNDNPFKSRFSIYPFIVGLPITILLVMVVVYHLNITWALDAIQNLVSY
ncbi:MAG: type VI secretion system protein ImpK [Gammaproteobacteria bacterium]|jgi:type VI secretion system protein ImpK